VSASRAGTEELTLTYRIAPGPKTDIVMTGVTLTAALRTRLEAAWTASVFDQFLVEEVTEVVRQHLAEEGYRQPTIDVRVTGDEVAKTLTITVEPGDRSQGGPVPVPVEASPLMPQLATVTFTGNLGLAVEQLREAAAMRAGGSYDPVEADAARGRLVTLLRFEGFMNPDVQVTAAAQSPTSVHVTFAIEAGLRQVLRDVAVVGNRAIDTDVIVAAVGITPNTPLTAAASLRARTRVFDTGLFRRVDVAVQELTQAELEGGQGPVGTREDEAPVRLVVTVEEWPVLRLRYGFQVAEERPEGEVEGRDLVPGVSADVMRRTLFGRAITTGAALQLQRREQLGRIFLNAPTLFGFPIGSSLVLERSRQEFSAVSLLTERSSISWEQRIRPTPALTLAYSYRFDRDHTFDTAPSDPNDPIGPFDVTVNISRLTGSAAWDTRDDPANSTQGWLASWSLEFAPEAAGSEIQFIRQLAQVYSFRPWRRVVLASAARFGLVRPLGGQELIFSERFYAGGARTVRGVIEEGLGARNFFDEPVGGEALLILNQEARVPIYKWLGGVAFIDAGNVFVRASDLSVRDLVGSLGTGLRLNSPFALLRVDYAKVVWGGGSDRSARWTFGIGHAF
jgi:outer membrane protein assembly factor BamA